MECPDIRTIRLTRITLLQLRIFLLIELHFEWLDKKTFTHVKETLAYDELTFVSNFGGALGLFLGFSFITMYDLIISMSEHFKK